MISVHVHFEYFVVLLIYIFKITFYSIMNRNLLKFTRARGSLFEVNIINSQNDSTVMYIHLVGLLNLGLYQLFAQNLLVRQLKP